MSLMEVFLLLLSVFQTRALDPPSHLLEVPKTLCVSPTYGVDTNQIHDTLDNEKSVTNNPILNCVSPRTVLATYGGAKEVEV
jgi:hypothetical protein